MIPLFNFYARPFAFFYALDRLGSAMAPLLIALVVATIAIIVVVERRSRRADDEKH
jgi:drug/metabolite transporter (DMT)-like permease